MKTICTAGIITVVLISTGSVSAQGDTSPPDFRETRWGMTPEQVKKTEPPDQLNGELPGLLSYDGEIAGIRAWILYLFDDDKLVRGVYSVETLQQDTVVKDYETIRAFLRGKYGEPTEEKINLKEDAVAGLDPANPEDRYALVLRKAMAPETIWDRGRTKIYLRLIEKDRRVAIMIDYIPPGNIKAVKDST